MFYCSINYSQTFKFSIELIKSSFDKDLLPLTTKEGTVCVLKLLMFLVLYDLVISVSPAIIKFKVDNIIKTDSRTGMFKYFIYFLQFSRYVYTN